MAENWLKEIEKLMEVVDIPQEHRYFSNVITYRQSGFLVGFYKRTHDTLI